MVNISFDASHRCLVEAASSAPLILTSTLLELVLPLSRTFSEKRERCCRSLTSTYNHSAPETGFHIVV